MCGLCAVARKDNAKRMLEKHFVNDIDYKVEKPAPPTCGAGFEGVNKVESFAPPTCGAKNEGEKRDGIFAPQVG